MIGMKSCQSNYTDLLFSLGYWRRNWIWALNSLLDEDCRTAGYYWGKTIAGVCLQWNLQVCMGGLDSHHSPQWSSLKNSLVLPQAIVIREHPYEYPVRCALACRVIIHRQWFPWPLTPALLCINWNIVITHARIHDWYGQESILLNSLHWCQQKHLKCNHPIEITPMTIISNDLQLLLLIFSAAASCIWEGWQFDPWQYYYATDASARYVPSRTPHTSLLC